MSTTQDAVRLTLSQKFDLIRRIGAAEMTWRERFLAMVVLAHQVGERPCVPGDARLLDMACLADRGAPRTMRRKLEEAGVAVCKPATDGLPVVYKWNTNPRSEQPGVETTPG